MAAFLLTAISLVPLATSRLRRSPPLSTTAVMATITLTLYVMHRGFLTWPGLMNIIRMEVVKHLKMFIENI